ncbi:internalin, putative, partial [hydrothermal vent metagenome]
STGVQVTDALPVGVTFASAAATQGTYNAGTGIWTVGTLASSATVTLTVVATVDAGTVGNTIVNTATKSGGSGLDVDAMNNTASASLTVRGADLAISKTIDNATPNPGDMITYTVTAINSGPTNATGVAISDGLPPGLTLVSASATNGSYVGSTWTVGALPTGASAILTIIATVDAGTAGSDIVNTASVLSNDLVDPVAGNNSASAQLRVPLVDIAVTKTTNNATPLPGDTFTYTVAATNIGPDTATGVTVDDVIPAALTLTGVSATQGSYTADTWSVGSLASGATETIIFTVSVPAGTPGGAVTNTAAVSGVNETESSTANNSASAVVTIAQSDISITKTVDVAAPNPGDAVTYTVTVTNNGPDAGTGVVVADSLPNGVTETASSASQGSFTDPTWTVGALVSGASATLTIDATVDAGTAGTTQTNTATGSSDQADPNPSNNVAGADIAVPAVDLAITKTVNNGAPNPGDMITYTVSVTNNGPDTATAVTVADTVPSGVTFVSASPSQGSYASGVWTVGTITNGGNATLTIGATVDVGTAGTTISNTASLLS